jgi:hypothetical protein
VSEANKGVVPAAEIIRSIGGAHRRSDYVDGLHPVAVVLLRDLLAEQVRQSLAAIRRERDPALETTEEREAAEHAQQQHVNLLGWLTAQGEMVAMSMFPSAEHGMGDLEELLGGEEEGDELPF